MSAAITDLQVEIVEETPIHIVLKETGPQGNTGEGVAAGGVSGQILTKQSSTDYDAEWVDAPVKRVNGYAGDVVLSKSDIDLGNVDNTSDANKPISTAAQTALDAKANSAHSHAISDTTGLQTALDAKATLSDITVAINNLVDAAPGTLDTLNELATALGDDPNFATTVTNSLANKQPIDSTLISLASHNTNGLLTQTAADTFTGRTITGTANQITVTNGDGVSGNPTLALPQDIHTGASPTFAGETINGKLNITTTGINTVLGTSTSVTGEANIDVTHLGTSSDINRMKINHYSRNSAGTMLLNSQIQTRLSTTTAGAEVSQFAIQGYTAGVYGVVFNIDYGNIYNVGSITPRTNLSYSVGSSANYWANMYTNKLFLNSTATIDGSTAGTVTVTGILKSVGHFQINGYNAMTIGPGTNIVLDTTTGTKIGTSTLQKLAFYNSTPIAKQTGVAVTADAIHAALVNLGLIAA